MPGNSTISIYQELSGRLLGVPWMLTGEKLDKLIRIVRETATLAAPMQKAVTDLSEPERYRKYTGDGIGVIPVEGLLLHTGTGYEWLDRYLGITTYGQLASWFDQAVNDAAIRTVVFRHRTAGGEVSGLFDFVDRVYAGRSQKRLIAVADEYSFSAGYAIFSAASERYLSRTGSVGSIGVRAVHVDQSGFDEKMGLTYETFFEGARKNDFDPHAPLSEEAKQILKAMLKETMQLFTATAARNLGISEEKIRATEAGIFSGKNAVSAGLADAVMPYAEVLRSLQSQPARKGAGKMPSESTLGAQPQQAAAAGDVDIEKIRRQASDEGRKVERVRQQGIREKVALMGFCLSEEAQEKLVEKLVSEDVPLEAAAGMILQAAVDQARETTVTSTTTPLGGGSHGDPWNRALLAECRKRAGQSSAHGGNA